MPKTGTTVPSHKTRYPSKRLKGKVSSSQSPWDQTRFTSREHEYWCRLHEDKDFIIEKSMVDNKDDYFHISEMFALL